MWKFEKVTKTRSQNLPSKNCVFFCKCPDPPESRKWVGEWSETLSPNFLFFSIDFEFLEIQDCSSDLRYSFVFYSYCMLRIYKLAFYSERRVRCIPIFFCSFYYRFCSFCFGQKTTDFCWKNNRKKLQKINCIFLLGGAVGPDQDAKRAKRALARFGAEGAEKILGFKMVFHEFSSQNRRFAGRKSSKNYRFLQKKSVVLSTENYRKKLQKILANL